MLYQVVVKWGESQQQDSMPPLSALLSGVLPAVRWPLMSRDSLGIVARSGIVPVDLLLPTLLNPDAGLNMRRSFPQLNTLTYVWRRPCTPDQQVSPRFAVLGYQFYLTSTCEDGWLSLYIHTLHIQSPPLFVMADICLESTGDQSPWWSRSLNRCFCAHDSWGFLKAVKFKECFKSSGRLHGDNKNQLQFRVTMRVDRSCKLQLLPSPDDIQYFEYRLPAVVLQKRLTEVPLHALGIEWELQLQKTGASSFDVSIRSVAKPPSTDTFEFTNNFRHASDDKLTDQSRSKTPLRLQGDVLKGTISYREPDQLSLSTFVWPSNLLVLRCCLERTLQT